MHICSNHRVVEGVENFFVEHIRQVRVEDVDKSHVLIDHNLRQKQLFSFFHRVSVYKSDVEKTPRKAVPYHPALANNRTLLV